MNKKELQLALYESFVTSYLETRNNVGFHLLKMALIVLDAKNKLSKRTWSKWLKDPRVKLKSTQAKKLVIIADKCQNNGQLTDLLNKDGIEKTYIICKLENCETQKVLIPKILNLNITVVQLKKIIYLIENDSLVPEKAIETVQNMPKTQGNKKSKRIVSIEEFEQIKHQYEQVIEMNKKLQTQVKQLQQNQQKQEHETVPKNEVPGQLNLLLLSTVEPT